jgi:polysaccharide biosynthesis protein PelG
VAGIGFVLRRVVTDTGPAATLKGYLAAAVVASGPWLLSVATMATLGVISAVTLRGDEKSVLFGAILYAYAFSLMCIGPVQLVFTRYVADKEYLGERHVLGSVFCVVVVLTLAVLFVPAALFVVGLPDLPLVFKLAMLALFIGSAGTWLALTFLSAAKDYALIVLGFGGGYAVGLVAAIIVGPRFGPTGYLAAFTLGQMVVFGLLTAGALKEFEVTAEWHLDVFGYLKKYPALVLVGLSYNLGIWVDKLVFWFAPTGISLVGSMHAFPTYDRAMFLSSLAMVPGLTVFVLRVETDFYTPYREFFDGIMGKSSLSVLRQARQSMMHALREGFAMLLKVQVVTTLIGLLVETPAAALAGLEPGDVGLFRVGLLANSVEVMLLVSLLGLLYFDRRRSAALVATCFLVSNFGLTLLTIQLGSQWYGVGYLGASLLTLALAQRLLWQHLDQLEYHTFTHEAQRAEFIASRRIQVRRGL